MIPINLYEPNEALQGENLIEVFQQTSGGLRREKKLSLTTLKDFIIGSILSRIGGVGTVPEWSDITNYTAMTLVRVDDAQYVTINTSTNLNKPPLANPLHWFPVPSWETLKTQFASGLPISLGMSPICDRAGGDYRQNSIFGKYTVNGTSYTAYRVALDGTVVTGNSTLETILSGYWRLDLYAPEVGGVRTLIDIGDYVLTPQSDSSGDALTIGELVVDQFQGHTFRPGDANIFNASGVGIIASGTDSQLGQVENTGDPVADNDNGTPRTGSTTHGKRFTVGVPHIIVIKED